MSLLFYLNLDFFFIFIPYMSKQKFKKVKFGSNKIGSQQMHLVFGFSLNHIIMTAMRCLVVAAGAFEIFDLPQQVELKLQIFKAFFFRAFEVEFIMYKKSISKVFGFFFYSWILAVTKSAYP